MKGRFLNARKGKISYIYKAQERVATKVKAKRQLLLIEVLRAGLTPR
jgi:hypothetical protein